MTEEDLKQRCEHEEIKVILPERPVTYEIVYGNCIACDAQVILGKGYNFVKVDGDCTFYRK